MKKCERFNDDSWKNIEDLKNACSLDSEDTLKT